MVVKSSEVKRKTVNLLNFITFKVKAMVRGKDRRPELGHKLALEYRKTITYPMKNKNSRYNNETQIQRV